MSQEVQSQGELSEIRQFDAHGNLLSFTDRAGFIWTKTYDALHRVKTETSPNGDIKKWNYQGDTIVCTLPSGEKTIQRYEAGALAESKTLLRSKNVLSFRVRFRKKAIPIKSKPFLMKNLLNSGLPMRMDVQPS